MGMVNWVLVIFYTVDTYSWYPNKGDFVDIKEKIYPRNIKGIEKYLDIFRYGIIEYYVRSESGRMIALRDQTYYVPGLPKDLHIILPQGIIISEG